MPRVPFKGLNAILLFLVLPVVAFVLLVGGCSACRMSRRRCGAA